MGKMLAIINLLGIEGVVSDLAENCNIMKRMLQNMCDMKTIFIPIGIFVSWLYVRAWFPDLRVVQEICITHY